jgi:cytochrome P450
VLRDPATFTVDDPRFTTARVVGPSMLSLDGSEHRRHRDPFARALRRGDVSAGLAAFTTETAARLVAGLAPDGQAELRRALAGPLAVAVMAEVLGLRDTDHVMLLSWYDAIVAGVSALTESADAPVPATASAAFGELRDSLETVISQPESMALLAVVARTAGLDVGEIVSNAAVMLFGGIETTEGMICNAVFHLLCDGDGDGGRGGDGDGGGSDDGGDDDDGAPRPGQLPGQPRGQLRALLADRSLLGGAVDESLRLEPAAAEVDRYATADIKLGGADIAAGDLIIVSLAGANRDPAFFPDPDRFDIRRSNARQNLGFALGPHFCVGAQLARMETEAAITALLDQLPGLTLTSAEGSHPRGLVFRKPPELRVRWPR